MHYKTKTRQPLPFGKGCVCMGNSSVHKRPVGAGSKRNVVCECSHRPLLDGRCNLSDSQPTTSRLNIFPSVSIYA